jgi:hypothetical protein
MTAGRADFFCTKGTAFTGIVTVKNPDLGVASLQYWGARMQVRRSYGADSALIELSTTNGRIQYDTETAKITLSLSASETSGLELGAHVYDLEVHSTGSKPATLKLTKGTFSVE